MGFLGMLVAIAVTALCWGTYGPVLHFGRDAMDSPLRPFVCVGIAYFLIAVLVPLLLLARGGERGGWTVKGTVWSLLAGTAGALGALGIILALQFGGRPIYVMPLVFGGAPVVNTLLSAFMNRAFGDLKAPFLAGLMLVILGAVTVLVFKPQGAAAHGAAGQAAGTAPAVAAADADADTSGTSGTSDPAPAAVADDPGHGQGAATAGGRTVGRRAERLLEVLLATALAMFSWGAYGPVLHKGQMAMGGSRLRPLICVGAAYFLIAVLVPLALLVPLADAGRWSTSGMLWSLAAGTLGAVGALGVIFAFAFGGKPFTVMPVVFGSAPVINTLVSTQLLHGGFAAASPFFYAGMLVVAAGAAIVLLFGPRGHAPPKPA
jgi:hypothetical protein